MSAPARHQTALDDAIDQVQEDLATRVSEVVVKQDMRRADLIKLKTSIMGRAGQVSVAEWDTIGVEQKRR